MAVNIATALIVQGCDLQAFTIVQRFCYHDLANPKQKLKLKVSFKFHFSKSLRLRPQARCG